MTSFAGDDSFEAADVAAEIELLKQATGESEPKDDPAPLFIGVLSNGKLAVGEPS